MNVGDLTILGAGSEWFWTMVSGLIVAVTFVIIYRQLHAQAAANAFQRIETVNGRWTSTEMLLARAQVAHALRDGILDVGDDTRVDAILGFFELLRDLHREGYLGDSVIARTFGSPILVWARLLGPVIAVHRAAESDPQMWIGTEELVEIVVRYDRGRGTDRVEILGSLPIEDLTTSVIRRETARLRLARDAASGVIPGDPPRRTTRRAATTA